LAVQPGCLPEELGRRLQPPQRIGADEVKVGRLAVYSSGSGGWAGTPSGDQVTDHDLHLPGR
jgi:hypothetical protein